ncbi:mannitol dehydrogenase family protein [Lewinella sp. 4G2]|uniref:mannitol dehydrogenase family protein n=1 Tax=Lewinella sp. 4G2 TaxID=1803372 RepID=UPI0007B48F18|nr:mannitol dehydrogenase family protein [Lewinella sp. 4G2]OAV44054.1 mannitol dehydrogenase [Lewinella sp. 4G2]
MQLNKQNLTAFAGKLPCPDYDRGHLQTGIVHIGVGGFHRSHQAYYVHQLLKDGTPEWGITGVGLREGDRAMAEVLQAQDGLYTLVNQRPNGTNSSEIIGSIRDYLLAPDNPDAVIQRMAHPKTKIVSLTITEGGYNLNAATEEFDLTNPDVQYEIAHPQEPRTVFGYLAAALRKRKAGGHPAFTVLSCDNIQHNGNVARRMLLAFARHQDPELAGWIEKEVTFPNSMVDRITPVTTPEVSEYLFREFELEDGWPVVCEPFIQWVVEDNFVNGRPPLETVGVQFVPDVSPYEKMKIRLLNAGHSVLGIPGALHGHPTIDACMRDKVFAGFMRAFMDQEVTPILDPVAGIDLEAYKDQLEARFANPNIRDGVGRICSESSAKLPKFLQPTLRENLRRGGEIHRATFILAAWCYYSDQRHNEKNEPLEILDERAAQLHRAAAGTTTDPISFLRQESIFGDLSEQPRFVEAYTEAVRLVYDRGDVRSLMADW